MKVKDAINIWLLVWNKKKQFPVTLHYFHNKSKSLCGKSKHPKAQPNAAYIYQKKCKSCEKLYAK